MGKGLILIAQPDNYFCEESAMVMMRYLHPLFKRFTEETGRQLEYRLLGTFEDFAAVDNYSAIDCLIVEVYPKEEQRLIEICELAFEQGVGTRIIFWGRQDMFGVDWQLIKLTRPHYLHYPFWHQDTDPVVALAELKKIFARYRQQQEGRR